MYATTYAGKPTCPCGVAWLPAFEARLATFGIRIRFTQLIGSYGPSAGTHGAGLCFDYVITNPGSHSLDRAYSISVREARLMGADATWERPYNWDGRRGIRHGHGLGSGCPHLAQAARNQQAAVRNGRNGLANNGPDTGPRPLSGRTFQQGIAWAKASAPKPRPKPKSDPVPEEDEMKRIGIYTNDNGSWLYAIVDTTSGFVKVIANGSSPVDKARLDAWAVAWNIPGWVQHQPPTYHDWVAEARALAKVTR